MNTPFEVKSKLAEQLQKQIQELSGATFLIEFERPAKDEYGDFATSVALKLASAKGENPRDTAEKIVSALNLPPEISKCEIAGPGFINFTYSAHFLLGALKAGVAQKPASNKGKIIVEYSSPNVAKPLGVHHLLSTVIGQSLNNILKESGYDTTSINYLGDWGTQFGKLIFAYKKWGDRAQIETNPIDELLKLYVKFHDEAEIAPELEDEGRKEFQHLEEGDEENRKIWQWIVDLSKLDLQKVYSLLGGIHFDVFAGEAEREPDLQPVLEEGKKEGIITKGEKGAFIIDLEKEGMIPFLVQKSDGATLYSTRDICTIKHRIATYNPTKIIYVVDTAQSLHFKQLFASVTKFKWFDKNLELKHVSFGRMRFADKKMSTRKGNIIYLEELLHEAVSRAKKIVVEKNPDLANIDEVARIIGTGAVKYSILCQAPETDIVFDWDKILNLDGNSAPYLQYGYARAKSILRNLNMKPEIDQITTYEFNKEEADLIKILLRFNEVIQESAQKYRPNIIANYLFETAQKFNAFYANCPVMTAENDTAKNIRAHIIEIFTSELARGLELLAGIEVVEEM